MAAALAAGGCGQKKPEPASTPAHTTPTTTATATATATAGAKPSTGRRTIVGDDVPTRFGDVQVAVTLRGSRIVDVRGVKLPFDRPRSQFISQNASPVLRQEVLNAQSARIDLLSGATYTSDAWATSVQSALQRAG